MPTAPLVPCGRPLLELRLYNFQERILVNVTDGEPETDHSFYLARQRFLTLDLRALTAPEPSKERPEHEPRLGCKRDTGADADDDPDRQAQHSSKPDSGPDAHKGVDVHRRGNSGRRSADLLVRRSAAVAYRPTVGARRDPRSWLSSSRLGAASCCLVRVTFLPRPFAFCRL